MAEQSPDQEPLPSEADSLRLEKQRLECEKLRAEITQVSLSWWKRPGYLGGLAPIVIALVGFLSAWSTGFFDTQRDILAKEIDNLKLEQQGLETRNSELIRTNAAIQDKIDRAYISLKMARANVSYTLSHAHAFGPPLSDNQRKSIETASKSLPQDVSKLLMGLLEKIQHTEEVVSWTEEDLKGLDKLVQTIPASKWAVELQWVGPGPIPALRAPDGRFYNPADGKFYETLEALKGQ